MTPTPPPHGDTPAHPAPALDAAPAPDDFAFVTRHWRTLATMAAVLASAGYLVVSPKEQVQQIRSGFDKFVMLQKARDSVQDIRIGEIRDVLRDELRELRENQANQMLAECLRTTAAFARVKLQCEQRLRGER